MNNLPEILSGKNINFLIGSGASMPLFPTLYLGNNLPSFEEFISAMQISQINKKILFCYYYTKWISPMNLSGLKRKRNSIKYWKVVRSYKLFVKSILEILEHESNERPKRANIFTTNYDLLFETNFDAISEINPICFFNDGSKGFISRILDTDNFYLNLSHSGYHDNYRHEVPTINLFKMHGSVSWEEVNGRIGISYNNKLIKSLDEKVKNIDNFKVTVIDKIFLSLDSKKDITTLVEELDNNLTGLLLDESKINVFYDEYIKLPIINPDKWKFHDTVFEQHYYQLIRSFSYELEKKNTVLVIFAFSFADEHIFNIFKRSLLNPTLQVIIIAFDEKMQIELKSKFIGFNNITYYPLSFVNEDGTAIKGDFNYLNNLLRGLN